MGFSTVHRPSLAGIPLAAPGFTASSGRDLGKFSPLRTRCPPGRHMKGFRFLSRGNCAPGICRPVVMPRGASSALTVTAPAVRPPVDEAERRHTGCLARFREASLLFLVSRSSFRPVLWLAAAVGGSIPRRRGTDPAIPISCKTAVPKHRVLTGHRCLGCGLRCPLSSR